MVGVKIKNYWKRILAATLVCAGYGINAQQIGNYVTNGSYETLLDCNPPLIDYKAIGWSTLDSVKFCAALYSSSCGTVPKNNVGYQQAFDGVGYCRMSLYCPDCLNPFTRSNYKSRLKSKLQPGVSESC